MPAGTTDDRYRREGIHAALTIERPARGVVVLRISGHDVGEFGVAPMLELERDFAAGQPVALFVDGRRTAGVTMEVSGEWARWLAAHREHWSAIGILTGSRLVEVTADFVRRFAGLKDIMRVYDDPAAFDRALAAAVVEAGAERDRPC